MTWVFASLPFLAHHMLEINKQKGDDIVVLNYHYQFDKTKPCLAWQDI